MFDRLRRESALEAIAGLGTFQTMRWLEQTDSTNRYVARALRSEADFPLPALIVADEQTAGVGRGANSWWSPQGCLMFTMALPKRSSESDFPRLPLRVGLAVAKTLAAVSANQPRIKWPNDVYIDDRKVCGILIETQTNSRDTSEHDVSIIGVGINCQVDLSAAPFEIQLAATSLHRVVSPDRMEETTREAVLVTFLQHWLSIEERTEIDPRWMDREWNRWCWLNGRCVEVSQPHATLVGIMRGIDGRGALLLEDARGRTQPILSGTVRAIDS